MWNALPTLSADAWAEEPWGAKEAWASVATAVLRGQMETNDTASV